MRGRFLREAHIWLRVPKDASPAFVRRLVSGKASVDCCAAPFAERADDGCCSLKARTSMLLA
jgi:hypothetical protein